MRSTGCLIYFRSTVSQEMPEHPYLRDKLAIYLALFNKIMQFFVYIFRAWMLSCLCLAPIYLYWNISFVNRFVGLWISFVNRKKCVPEMFSCFEMHVLERQFFSDAIYRMVDWLLSWLHIINICSISHVHR